MSYISVVYNGLEDLLVVYQRPGVFCTADGNCLSVRSDVAMCWRRSKVADGVPGALRSGPRIGVAASADNQASM